jgi:hypothetical protein
MRRTDPDIYKREEDQRKEDARLEKVISDYE